MKGRSRTASIYDILQPAILKTDTGVITKLQATADTPLHLPKHPAQVYQNQDGESEERVSSLEHLQDWTRRLLSENAASNGEAATREGTLADRKAVNDLVSVDHLEGESIQSPLNLKGLGEPLSAVAASKLSSKSGYLPVSIDGSSCQHPLYLRSHSLIPFAL